MTLQASSILFIRHQNHLFVSIFDLNIPPKMCPKYWQNSNLDNDEQVEAV